MKTKHNIFRVGSLGNFPLPRGDLQTHFRHGPVFCRENRTELREISNADCRSRGSCPPSRFGPQGSSPPEFVRARETISGSSGGPAWTKRLRSVAGIGPPVWSPPAAPWTEFFVRPTRGARARESISRGWGRVVWDTGPPGSGPPESNSCATQEIPATESPHRDVGNLWRSYTSAVQWVIEFRLCDRKKFSRRGQGSYLVWNFGTPSFSVIADRAMKPIASGLIHMRSNDDDEQTYRESYGTILLKSFA